MSWVLPALGAAYHHVSWLCLQQVGNVLSFAGRDRDLGDCGTREWLVFSLHL